MEIYIELHTHHHTLFFLYFTCVHVHDQKLKQPSSVQTFSLSKMLRIF